MSTPTPYGTQAANNYCYRHPDRQSFVLCQRCARTICSECQSPLPVGVICPECKAKAQRGAKATQRAAAGGYLGQWRRRLFGSDSPVTYALLLIITGVGILQVLTGFIGNGLVTQELLYNSVYTLTPEANFQPWRMLTAAFVHGGLLHYAMNSLTLWLFGRAIEPVIGSLRFAVFFIVAALAGSLAVDVLAPGTSVVGASGAIFGMFGAWFIMLRRSGQDVTGMVVLIVLNVITSFINPGISWQAHLGGLLVGLLCGALLAGDMQRGRMQGGRRVLGMGGLWAMIGIGVLCAILPPILASSFGIGIPGAAGFGWLG